MLEVRRERDERAPRDDERGHVIYMTATADYCREDAPVSIRTRFDLALWARNNFKRVADYNARQHVTRFRCEWW